MKRFKRFVINQIDPFLARLEASTRTWSDAITTGLILTGLSRYGLTPAITHFSLVWACRTFFRWIRSLCSEACICLSLIHTHTQHVNTGCELTPLKYKLALSLSFSRFKKASTFSFYNVFGCLLSFSQYFWAIQKQTNLFSQISLVKSIFIWVISGLFFLNFRLFNSVCDPDDRKSNLTMTGWEWQISWVGSNRSTN